MKSWATHVGFFEIGKMYLGFPLYLINKTLIGTQKRLSISLSTNTMIHSLVDIFNFNPFSSQLLCIALRFLKICPKLKDACWAIYRALALSTNIIVLNIFFRLKFSYDCFCSFLCECKVFWYLRLKKIKTFWKHFNLRSYFPYNTVLN